MNPNFSFFFLGLGFRVFLLQLDIRVLSELLKVGFRVLSFDPKFRLRVFNQVPKLRVLTKYGFTRVFKN
jgi:hypothetical protein